MSARRTGTAVATTRWAGSRCTAACHRRRGLRQRDQHLNDPFIQGDEAGRDDADDGGRDPICLYGVMAFAAAQRRGALATRIALGASGRQVFWLMMSDGHRLMAIGVMLGLALAYVAGRIVSGSVFEMRAADPVVLLTAGAVVASVAWFATMVPAMRASRQNPVGALRD